MSTEEQAEFGSLEARIKTILPEEYQDTYEDVQPVSMGSAGLKYGDDGKVAWDEIWGSFCDLAMAGGPPHKGTLLEPGTRAEIEEQREQYLDVEEEICRGITMVTELDAEPSPELGWVRVHCHSEGMAGWLVRAIAMENVSVRCEGRLLDLPAGPGYRLEKEIKNVVTVIAKTCHYWSDHMWPRQQREIGELFSRMAVESPLVQPGKLDDEALRVKMSAAIERGTGLRISDQRSLGWLGVECSGVRAAIWMMRALVASNVLARREGTVLFVPVNLERDPNGRIVVRSVTRVHEFARARAIL
jgi:sirohydrochlorin cobaltochelatase